MSVTVNQPSWARWRPLAWLAKVFGCDRHWTARGADLVTLVADLRRLGKVHDFTVVVDEAGLDDEGTVEREISLIHGPDQVTKWVGSLPLYEGAPS